MLKKLLATFLSCALKLTIVPVNAFAMGNQYEANPMEMKKYENLRVIESQNRSLNIPFFVAISGAGATVSGLIAKVCGTPCTLEPLVCIVCLGGIILIGGGSRCCRVEVLGIV